MADDQLRRNSADTTRTTSSIDGSTVATKRTSTNTSAVSNAGQTSPTRARVSIFAPSLDSGGEDGGISGVGGRGSVTSQALTARPTARKSMRKEQMKILEAQKNKTVLARHIVICRSIVENKWFILMTTILTVYALVGDDARMLATDKPADDVFNGITLFCIVIFCLEIMLSSVGKDDYLGGFFFTLDCISTSTLSLDLTWISNMLEGDDEDMDNMSGAKTAQLGARTARVVRVLRLVRILKLYKAIYEARAAQKRQMDRMAAPGDDDDWEHAENYDEHRAKVESLQRGSRVGKKLSDLTTRKVIILVLSMMLFLPLLRVDSAEQFAFSPWYGADLVHESFKAYHNELSGKGIALSSSNDTVILRAAYAKQLLQFVYYHNWYTGQESTCPVPDKLCSKEYYNHVFWVGLVSKYESTDLAGMAADARLRQEEVTKWEKDVVLPQHDDYNFGTMPPSVQKTLGSPWTTKCDGQDIFRLGFSVLQNEVPGKVVYKVKCPEDLRKVEREKFSARIISTKDAKVWHFGFYFDKRQYTRQESMFSLLVTGFVCIVLTIASVQFTNDADRLVLGPLEIMISKVERIRDNPLMAMKMSDEEFRQEEVRKHKDATQEINRTRMQIAQEALLCKAKKKYSEPMETVILEKTIIKIGSLLALGFGEAGANIIEQNMSGGDSAMVTAMVGGERVDCIIGIARIADFGIATEVLGGNVMTFVNQVSEIVHGVTDAMQGAPNKNNGSKFYLIWRTSDLDEGYSNKVADMAIFAVTRILGAVHRSPALMQYRKHPGLQQKLGTGCRVNLSFALHYGWAIEGAVGSEFKIDASYLSPNVRIAESLEIATYIYGVPILLSERVVQLSSPEMASKCRQMDKVRLTGEVMELYAIDLDYTSLYVQKPVSLPAWNPRQRFKVRQFLEVEKSAKWSDEVDIATLFNDDPDVSTMRFRYTLEFTHVFNMGYVNYAEGEWDVAQRFLMLTRTMLGVEDGPSAALLHYMESPYQFEAPPWWRGIRDLGQDIANLALD